MAAMDVEMASPVGPLVAVAYDRDHLLSIPAYQSELDLCQLLQAMSLTKGKFKAPETETVDYAPRASQSANGHDASTEDPAYYASLPRNLLVILTHPSPLFQSDASESSSSKCSCSDQPRTDPLPISATTTTQPSQIPACHFLQSILASLAPESPVLSPSPYPYPAAGALQTTNGAYLDTLLVHRSLLAAFPPAHKGCAAVLHEIARAIEVRAWQADRDSDAEAVAALRQEAYIVAHWM